MPEHHQIGRKNKRIGYGLAGRLAALEARVHGADLLGQLGQGTAAIGATGELDSLGRAA